MKYYCGLWESCQKDKSLDKLNINPAIMDGILNYYNLLVYNLLSNLSEPKCNEILIMSVINKNRYLILNLIFIAMYNKD